MTIGSRQIRVDPRLYGRSLRGAPGIWFYNARHRGVEQATTYEEFLVDGIDGLASRYDEGRPLEGFPSLLTMTFRKRPRGDGHVAVYEIDEAAQTVTILHVFHTKQDLASRLRSGP